MSLLLFSFCNYYMICEMNINKVMVFEAVFTSSSSSESDDEEMKLFLDESKRRKIPRVKYFIETVIYAYNNKQFKQHFRMSRNTFYFLLNLLKPYLQTEESGPVISPEKQLYIALYVLGTPDSYRSIVTKFDVGNATAWRAVKRVVKGLCYFRNYFIHWPTFEEAEITSRYIQRKYNFPGVIGMVDGTHITIAAPKDNALAYINRKGHHSLQLQVVCNEKKEFIHCYAGMPGSVHDMRVFKYSGLQQKCNDNFFYNKHLIGDSAYTLQKSVMVPYKDNGHLTADETNYNYALSRSRMFVEQSIGLLKGRWRYLLDKLPMRRTDLIPYYIIACCILHNICLLQRDEIEYPIILPNEILEDAGPLTVTPQQQEGIIKREQIKNSLL
ncbi:PREDICTED: putative nuclease HARBI1 [Cyphomyrmex costatus]|uniref:putative nuclease HARBI1 n=1 Tax=Cyphomyrmex costatus TaxID=456900 RepID=UPI0008523E5C|nr:PREDICTED: putative nuclease HARBI1 [Cyphomyrmex costatus]